MDGVAKEDYMVNL